MRKIRVSDVTLLGGVIVRTDVHSILFLLAILMFAAACDDSESSEADSDSPSAQSFDADDLASSIADDGASEDVHAEPEAEELSMERAAELGIDLSQF